MDATQIGNMRLKQVAVMNGIFLGVIIIFFIVIEVFTVTFAQFFVFLGVVMLIQGVYGLLKGDSPKSIFSIFEQVAVYEKQKMGSEWYKQRKIGFIWNLIIGCLMFLQSIGNVNTTGDVLEFDLFFLAIIVFFMFVVTNFSLIIHFRKIDRSTSENDFKGYARKSSLRAVAVGLILGVVFALITLSYIFSVI
ncbi:hypothetical protein M3182_02465 [Mesobacillus maritimus]|uniref:hypothetical protein n=1 Tax=Mesobacillus maritimus TaxID=1643336 RepID=UPI0020417099|nr:hypothetical protein [Mesobacillus maritimus]MCM3584605.1 hypothetical protein [Mesobacillus maritimus]MCM3671418.1 hypothetical protein [Mesobacillus maritimus]